LRRLIATIGDERYRNAQDEKNGTIKKIDQAPADRGLAPACPTLFRRTSQLGRTPPRRQIASALSQRKKLLENRRTEKPMTFHFCGYFPKKKTPRPEGYDLPGVVDIASVSNCVAGGPEDWIKSWTFNELGFFDDVEIAESVVPVSDRSQFEVYAYELLDQRFDGGIASPWSCLRWLATPRVAASNS
jgi:hypothetical protein